MKRDVERRKALPAFSIGIGELEVLWTRLVALFESPEKVHGAINIKLPSETLKFESFEELKQYTQLRGRIANFTIYINQGPRRIWIASRSEYFFSSPTAVEATAENEAWCAGAVDTAYSFLQLHRVWYHWIVSAPLDWILLLLMNLITIKNLFLPNEIVSTNSFPLVASWLTITGTLAGLFLIKGKLMPWSTLRFPEDEGFIRRHVGELSLIVALVALAVAVIQLFIGK